MDRNMPVGNPHPTKNRYLAPPFDIAVRARNRNLPINRLGWKDLNGPKDGNVAFFNTRHMLLSGCRDNQTSADAYINGQYQGAMTAALAAAMDQSRDADWIVDHTAMLKYLSANGYTQVPQLSGPERVLRLPIFRGL
jgi:hypothetical protein